MATNTNQKLAVLIDADNAQASVICGQVFSFSRYFAYAAGAETKPKAQQ